MVANAEIKSIILPVGKSGNLRVAVEADGNGLVNPRTLNRIARGEMSGERVGYRIKAGRILDEGVAPEKDHFLLRLAAEGTVSRERFTNDSQAFNYKGFSEKIADGLGIEYNTVNRLLRLMRADLAYEEPFIKPFIRAKFGMAVQSFLSDRSKRHNEIRAKQPRRISANWDYSIRGFYRVMSHAPTTTKATWLPYEVGAFSTFYFDRASYGRRLTTFDKIVLQGIINNIPVAQTAREVSEESYVPVDDMVIVCHRHLLLNGSAVGAPSDPQDELWWNREP